MPDRSGFSPDSLQSPGSLRHQFHMSRRHNRDVAAFLTVLVGCGIALDVLVDGVVAGFGTD